MTELTFIYKNHRGEVKRRRVIPNGLYFGSNAWHPEPQWLMDGYDLDLKAERTFAIRDVVGETFAALAAPAADQAAQEQQR